MAATFSQQLYNTRAKSQTNLIYKSAKKHKRFAGKTVAKRFASYGSDKELC
jgi:hypothetical protein